MQHAPGEAPQTREIDQDQLLLLLRKREQFKALPPEQRTTEMEAFLKKMEPLDDVTIAFYEQCVETARSRKIPIGMLKIIERIVAFGEKYKRQAHRALRMISDSEFELHLPTMETDPEISALSATDPTSLRTIAPPPAPPRPVR